MLKCPFCYTALSFSSNRTNAKLCTCGKVIFRNDGQLAATSIPAATKSEDFIVPGTTGEWEGKKFTITGRFEAVNDWMDHWSIVFENGDAGFLAEGNGNYLLLTETAVSHTLPSHRIKFLEINDYVELREGERFFLTRKVEQALLRVEGEVYLPSPGENITILGLYSDRGNYITVFYFNPESIAYLETTFVEFAELHLSGLLTGDEFKTYNCLNCFKPLKSRGYPLTTTLSCIPCGTHHLVNAETGQLQKLGTNKEPVNPDIKIGCTGKINGIEYTVVGFSHKEENNADRARWKEYSLFNPEHGFGFLSEFEGHWIYVKEKMRPPLLGMINGDEFSFGQETYQLFNSYSYTVISAAGEHPYDIIAAEEYTVKEFISPPRVWYVEQNKKESNWFVGHHVEGQEVFENFVFPNQAPAKVGVGMVQPTGMINKSHFFYVLIISIVLIVGIHVLTGMAKQERVISEDSYTFPDSALSVNIVIPKFSLDKWKSNMEFHVVAPVANSWVEVSGTLINTDNGKEYSFEKGVEYYFGYSEGEKWSEGSNSEDAYLTGIPPGNYVLNLTGRRESFNAAANFSIRVMYDVRTDRNFWIAILMVGIFAATQYIVFHNYDKRRWQNSRYSTYSYED